MAANSAPRTAQTDKRKPAQRPPQSSEAVTIGVVGLLVLSLVGYVGWRALRNPFLLKAKYSFADGLKPGAEVRVAGVKAGTVKAIRFLDIPATKGQSGLFEVIFSFDPRIGNRLPSEVIRKDARAILISTGALGDRTIDIFPGSTNAPPTQSGDYIEGGIESSIAMVIDKSETMQQNFNRARDIVDTIGTEVEQGRGNIGLIGKGEHAREIARLRVETETLQKQLDQGKGTIGRFQRDKRFANNLDQLTKLTEQLRKNIDAGQGSAGKFLADKELSSRFDRLQARLTKISDNFERAYNSGGGKNSLARFQEAKFQSDMKELNQHIDQISRMVSERKGTAGLLVHDNRLSENVSTISAETLKLVYDIREKPFKYIKFKFF